MRVSETAAPVLGRNVERLDRRLGGQEVADGGEAGVGIFLGNVEDLQAGLGRAVTNLGELGVQLFRRGLRGLADLLEALGGLADSDLGELADTLVGGLRGLVGVLDDGVDGGGVGGHGVGSCN